MAKQNKVVKKAAAKKIPDPQFRVVADTREQAAWTFSKSKVITDIIPGKLDAGDYTIEGLEDIFTIEKKASTSEIAGNFTESRWPGFLQRMQEKKYRYIICEFDWLTLMDFPYGSGIPVKQIPFIKVSSNFLISCISKIQVDLNIPFIFAGSRAGAESAAEAIMKRIYRLEY